MISGREHVDSALADLSRLRGLFDPPLTAEKKAALKERLERVKKAVNGALAYVAGSEVEAPYTRPPPVKSAGATVTPITAARRKESTP